MRLKVVKVCSTKTLNFGRDTVIIIHLDSLAESTEANCELYILYFVAATPPIVVLSVLFMNLWK